MLQELFYWIFNMSIVAGITTGIIALIRMVKRIPRPMMALLWLIPALRMIVPLGLSSPYSLMSMLSRITTKTVVVYQPSQDVSFSMMNMTMAANSYFPITYKTNILHDVFAAASIVWIIVALAILLLLAVLYVTTLRELKDSKHWRENIYLSEKVTSPAVYGIIRPRIVLPTTWADRDLDLVLFHEQTHIRRGDNLWRMLAFVIVALHWFNPVAWIFLKLLLTDLELACDEGVLVKLGPDRRKEYALSLLDSKAGQNVFASSFGGAKIRTRIENILSYRKMKWISLAAFAGLTLAISYVLLTNA